jgi:DNA methyltransferase 1-associated protein 1
MQEPKKMRRTESMMKRPSGMNREVYALLYSDSKDSSASSLIPTDTGCGYRQPRARLGRKQVRPWKWMAFTNPARSDGLVLSHWRRVADEGKEYPFAKFNKSPDIPTYTEEEYTKSLTDPGWSKEETDHLFELCRMFDVRFVVIQDRFDKAKYQKRSVEDLKERYYSVCNRLTKARSGDEADLIAYDAPHEVKRKMQMERLLARSREQVEEEEMLCAELKKIEMRKKEREKKQQDLQKLISAAEQNTSEVRKTPSTKKSSTSSKKTKSTSTPGQSKSDGSVVFKSYDKSSGVSLRSSKMKTPMTLGQKKTKAIDQLLEELGVGLKPMPTEQICVQFNELRNDILLLLELKAACDACDFELQSLKHRYENLPVHQQAKISVPDIAPSTPRKMLGSGIMVLDAVATATTGRKRRLTTMEPTLKKSRKS